MGERLTEGKTSNERLRRGRASSSRVNGKQRGCELDSLARCYTCSRFGLALRFYSAREITPRLPSSSSAGALEYENICCTSLIPHFILSLSLSLDFPASLFNSRSSFPRPGARRWRRISHSSNFHPPPDDRKIHSIQREYFHPCCVHQPLPDPRHPHTTTIPRRGW